MSAQYGVCLLMSAHTSAHVDARGAHHTWPYGSCLLMSDWLGFSTPISYIMSVHNKGASAVHRNVCNTQDTGNTRGAGKHRVGTGGVQAGSVQVGLACNTHIVGNTH